MAERLAALSPEQAAEAAERGLAGAAALLDSCFSAADTALAESGKDFSKSGCTAVLALLDRDSLSVAWAGDSRAVLGVCDTKGGLLLLLLGCLLGVSPCTELALLGWGMRGLLGPTGPHSPPSACAYRPSTAPPTLHHLPLQAPC